MARLAAGLVAAALLASASATVTIPVSRPKLKTSSMKSFVEAEAARRTSFAKAASSGTAPIVNEVVSYIAATTVGSQTFDLIVDTGSSNLWVGAGTKFSAGSTGKSTGDKFSVDYGSGSVSGTEYTDTVTLGGLTVSKQSIGVATKSSGFSGVDGIIGFGPTDLTEDTVSGVSSVPTFMDNLYSQGSISEEVLGVSFAPESGSDSDDQNGSLDLGGTDSSKYTGSITYTPVAGDFDEYWGIEVTSIKSGSTTLESNAAGIVDTGTTLIYIPETAYNVWLKDNDGTTNEDEGLAEFSKMPTADFSLVIGGTTFTLTPSQYIIPSDQAGNLGLSTSSYWSWISDGGSSSDDNLAFIIGQKWMENFYAVFDTTNNRVGFAVSAV